MSHQQRQDANADQPSVGAASSPANASRLGANHPLLQRVAAMRAAAAAGGTTTDPSEHAAGNTQQHASASTPPATITRRSVPGAQRPPAATGSVPGPSNAAGAGSGGGAAVTNTSGSRTPTQRPANAAALGGSFGGRAAAGADGAAMSPLPLATSMPSGDIRVHVRVPGFTAPLLVHVPLSFDDQGRHRDADEGALSRSASTGANGGGTSGPSSNGGAAAISSSASSSAGDGRRAAHGSDLADAFVPVLQATLMQFPELGTAPIHGTAQHNAHTRYTADAGAFDPARWQFAHRAEFIRAETALAGRLRDGDTVHGIFTEYSADEQRRRRRDRPAEPGPARNGTATGGGPGGPAAAAAVATAAEEGPAAAGPAAGTIEADMQTLVAGATNGTRNVDDLNPDQRRLLRLVATLIQRNEQMANPRGERDAATARRAADEALREAQEDADADAEDLAADRATGTQPPVLRTAEERARRRAERRARGGFGAIQHRFSRNSRVVEERWSEQVIADEMRAKWARRRAARTAGDRADNGTGDEDPLRHPDPHHGQAAVRLTDNDPAAGFTGPRTRLRGAQVIPSPGVDGQLQVFLNRGGFIDRAFVALLLLGVCLGPLAALTLLFNHAPSAKYFVAVGCGMILNMFLVALGNLDHQATDAVAPALAAAHNR